METDIITLFGLVALVLKRKPAGEISRSDIFAAVMKSAVSKQQQQLYSYKYKFHVSLGNMFL